MRKHRQGVASVRVSAVYQDHVGSMKALRSALRAARQTAEADRTARSGALKDGLNKFSEGERLLLQTILYIPADCVKAFDGLTVRTPYDSVDDDGADVDADSDVDIPVTHVTHVAHEEK
jgi:hypothetical protein